MRGQGDSLTEGLSHLCQLGTGTVLLAAGRLQSSKHLPSLNSLAYKENCIEQITAWNTAGREGSLEQNKVRSEELGERHLLLFIDFRGLCHKAFTQRAGPCSLA